ncbi:Aminoglycoside phosphotransferase [Gracilaria domingensis]|nr:Aminoglycoside phosphotransferase [Gracilaria domingensis]
MIAVILVEWAEAEKSVESGGTMKWMSHSELNKANWVETEKELQLNLRQVVLDTVKEINGEVHVWIPQWRRMGWFRKVLTWVKEVTKTEVDDRELYSTFMKIMDHHHSVVWRCELDLSRTKHASVSNGEPEYVYMKTAIPIFHEAKRTATIAKVLDRLKIVPHIIAIQNEDCTFLQRDAGSAEGEEKDAKLLLDTLRRMQLLSSDHLDELQAGGLEVRDSEWLLSNVHQLLYHKGLERAVKGSEEHEMILRDLRCREKEVKDVCKEISSFGIPNTLVHGDLSQNNMGSRKVLGGAGYQFFDWGLSHIGHPFIDVDVIIDLFAEDQPEIERWRHEYWQHWKSVVSAEEFWKLLRRVPLIGVCAGLDMFLRESEFHCDEWNGLRCRIRQYAEFFQHALITIKHSKSVS